MNYSKLHRYMALALATMSFHSVYAAKATPSVQQLQSITIIGNTINGIDNTLPNVDIINVSTLRNPGINSLSDALRGNPSVEININKAGQADQLRIRGFGQNYTELTLDGQPVPDYYVFGPYTSGGRDFIETDTLRQIDIIKGLHSPKQKNGALAGTVNMQTYAPADFVDAQHPYYGGLKLDYTSKNKGIATTATLAAKQNNLDGLLIYTHRRLHESKNFGSDSNQTLHNKENTRQNNLLAKGEWNLEQGKIALTGEYFKRDRHVFPRYAPPHSPMAQTYTEPTTRKRLSLSGEFEQLAGLDTANAQLSWRDYRQTTHGYAVNDYAQKGINMRIDGGKRLSTGASEHHILFGAELDFGRFNFKTEESPGNTIRYLPLTRRNTLSAYLKDKIDFNNGLSVSPGIRIEHERVHSSADALYSANKALKAQGKYRPHSSHTAVTPSLNAVMSINDNLTAHASYARGERTASLYNLGSFDHGFGFILPNPNLKTEKSNNYELGLSYVQPEQMELKLTGFYSRFKDFIAVKQDGTFGVTPYHTPKYIMRPFNVNRAKTYGIELEAGYHLSPELYAHASLAWMNGRIGAQASHGVVLAQSYPARADFDLDYHQDKSWGANLHWAVAGKGQKPTDKDQYRTPGHGTIDASGWWKPVENLTLTAGIYNITNKKYTLSADTNGLNTVDRRKRPLRPGYFDLYTQPKRNFAVGFNYAF